MNPNAEDKYKKIAPKDSPAGIAWAKQQTDKAANKNKGKSTATAAATTNVAESNGDSGEMEGLLARALDNADATTIVLGQAHLAH